MGKIPLRKYAGYVDCLKVYCKTRTCFVLGELPMNHSSLANEHGFLAFWRFLSLIIYHLYPSSRILSRLHRKTHTVSRKILLTKGDYLDF